MAAGFGLASIAVIVLLAAAGGIGQSSRWIHYVG
jgi:hypothetical protein